MAEDGFLQILHMHVKSNRRVPEVHSYYIYTEDEYLNIK